jgi:integrase
MAKNIPMQAINMLPKRIAHYPTLCGVAGAVTNAFDTKVIALIKGNKLNSIDTLLIDLLYTNGCRISEILAIRTTDIRNDGTVFIHGLKGSSDRIIHSTYNSEILIAMRNSNICIYQDVSRYYYYRLFKKLGLYFAFSDDSKNTVTHSFRHNYITKLQLEYKDIDFTRTQVGQKSQNSTLHYIKKSKKKL